MAYNTDLEQAIYKVICDEDIFDIGFNGTSAKIAEIVKPYIDPKLYINKNFNNHVRQLLETRCNCIRNKYITKSKKVLKSHPNDFYNNLIIRDIAMVKKDLKKPHGHNLYIFGCSVSDVISPVDICLD